MKKIFVVVETVMEDGTFDQKFSKAFVNAEDALNAFKKMRDDAYNSVFNYYSKDEIDIFNDTKADFTVEVYDDNFSHEIYIKELEVAD